MHMVFVGKGGGYWELNYYWLLCAGTLDTPSLNHMTVPRGKYDIPLFYNWIGFREFKDVNWWLGLFRGDLETTQSSGWRGMLSKWQPAPAVEVGAWESGSSLGKIVRPCQKGTRESSKGYCLFYVIGKKKMKEIFFLLIFLLWYQGWNQGFCARRVLYPWAPPQLSRLWERVVFELWLADRVLPDRVLRERMLRWGSWPKSHSLCV